VKGSDKNKWEVITKEETPEKIEKTQKIEKIEKIEKIVAPPKKKVL
jgi:hypothetical protein